LQAFLLLAQPLKALRHHFLHLLLLVLLVALLSKLPVAATAAGSCSSGWRDVRRL
jgi:hypothetical protein